MWRRHPCPLCMHRAAVCWSNKWPLQVHPAGSGHSKRSNTTSPSAWTWDPCSEPLDSLGPFLETFGDLKSVEISSHWKLALATNNRLAQHIWRIRWIPLVTKPYPLVKKWWTVMNHHIRMYQNHIWSTSYMAAALLPLQYHCDWTYQHLCQLPVREHPSKPKQHPRICVDVHVIGWIPEIVNRVLRYEYMEIKEMNPKRAAGANVKCEWSGDKN